MMKRKLKGDILTPSLIFMVLFVIVLFIGGLIYYFKIFPSSEPIFNKMREYFGLTIPDTGLILHFEDSGTQAKDSSGHYNNCNLGDSTVCQVCQGTATPCNSFESNTPTQSIVNACNNQMGCEWCGCYIKTGSESICSGGLMPKSSCSSPNVWKGCQGTATPCTSTATPTSSSTSSPTTSLGCCEFTGFCSMMGSSSSCSSARGTWFGFSYQCCSDGTCQATCSETSPTSSTGLSPSECEQQDGCTLVDVNNCPSWTTEAMVGSGALKFSSGSSINCGEGSDGSLNPTTGITLDFWIKLTSYPTSDISIIDKGVYSIGMNSDGQIIAAVTIGGSSHKWTTEDYFSINSWTHVVATFDSSTGIARTVINNKVSNLQETGGNQILLPKENIDTSNQDMVISAPNAVLDELRINNRALSSTEIMFHFQGIY